MSVSGNHLRDLLKRWWWLVSVGVALTLLIVWWGLGLAFRWRPYASGFSQTPIVVDAHEVELSYFLAKQFPGVEVRWEVDATQLAPLPVRVTGIAEDKAMRFIAKLSDLGIRKEGEAITVEPWPWWDRRYEQADDWIEQKLGVDLWPNR